MSRITALKEFKHETQQPKKLMDFFRLKVIELSAVLLQKRPKQPFLREARQKNGIFTIFSANFPFHSALFFLKKALKTQFFWKKTCKKLGIAKNLNLW